MTSTTSDLVGRAHHTVVETDHAGRLSYSLFAITVFLSASLVFLVEPLMAKLVLPTLGGSPAVWNTSLAFFQAMLLVGYAYAHLLQRLKAVRGQVLIHGAVLLAAALTLPLRITHLLGDPAVGSPALWLLGVLGLSIGLPFAALSATAPLIQAWYARARSGGEANPYVLYAASNLGSLVALLSYPALIEPMMRLRSQTFDWSLGYGAFLLLMGVVAFGVWRIGGAPAAAAEVSVSREPAITWKERLIWVALAAAPSSLMLGVTTHIATDVASAPLLWVVPLALYLLTFIIAFQAKPLIRRDQALLLQAAAIVACLLTFGLPIQSYALQAALDLVSFFLTALVCHQALAARRPPASQLTEFYLLMSLGGVVGGSFNAFVAPVIFKTVLEYPAVLLATCLARPWGAGKLSRREAALLAAALVAGAVAIGVGQSAGFQAGVKLMLAMVLIVLVMAFLLRDRAVAFLALCLMLMASSHYFSTRENVLLGDRDFFGVLRITRVNIPHFGEARLMVHGSTLHGAELLDPASRCRPLTYYANATPIGQVFGEVLARKPAVRIGAIGMGAGAVATYTRPGDSLRFFEIDPLVVRTAENPALFRYINGCAQGRIDNVLGDARLSLNREADNQFDILLVDAFSSDSVPAHLLTVEAMRLYLRHIRPDGVVIMHLSNRNLELLQPVAAIARAAGGAALQQAYRTPKDAAPFIDSSEDAIIVARTPAALAAFRGDPRWKPADPHGVRVWTDDYTNLIGALIRGVGHEARETR